MPLTVRLDHESEHCLKQLLAETGQDRSFLIRQLIRERWQQRQASPSIAQRIGGHPEDFLYTLPPGSADREQRRRLLGRKLTARQQEPLHQAVVAFFDQTAAQLITSPICIAEILILDSDFALYRRFRREPFCRVPIG